MVAVDEEQLTWKSVWKMDLLEDVKSVAGYAKVTDLDNDVAWVQKLGISLQPIKVSMGVSEQIDHDWFLLNVVDVPIYNNLAHLSIGGANNFFKLTIGDDVVSVFCQNVNCFCEGFHVFIENVMEDDINESSFSLRNF